MVTQAIATEEVARVCASTSVTLLISKLGMLPVMNRGSDELERTYLPKVASGESQASYCLSEADAGGDVAAMRTRAVRHGDHYLLSGTKYWITNAGVSDTYTVSAVTDPSAGRRGISCFLVEAGRGVEIAPHEDKLGLRGSPTAAVSFDEVRVPASNLVGGEGMGFTIAMHTLDRSRPTIGARRSESPRAPSTLPPAICSSGRRSASRSPTCRAYGSSWPRWPCGTRRPGRWPTGPAR